MEILKRGVIPPELRWEATCEVCQSVIAGNVTELLDNVDIVEEQEEYAICPVCSGTLYPKRA